MATICACGCGLELPPRSGPGRPAKYLAEHAPDKRQGRRKRSVPLAPVVQLSSAPSAPQPDAPPPPDPREPPLVAATRRELEAAKRADSPEGLILLQLAWHISAGGGTAAGLASLVRQYHTSKAAALDGAEDGDDVLARIFGA